MDHWPGLANPRSVRLSCCIYHPSTYLCDLPQALVDISNGLMRDPRAFHIDCSDWFEKYNRQGLYLNPLSYDISNKATQSCSNPSASEVGKMKAPGLSSTNYRKK
jgi:hypothetical protein